MISPPIESSINQVVERLGRRFPDVLPAHIVEVVDEELSRLASSTIRTYIPNLVEHSARARLASELMSTSGAVTP